MKEQSAIPVEAADIISTFSNRYSGGRWTMVRGDDGLIVLYRVGQKDGEPYLHRKVTQAREKEEVKAYFAPRPKEAEYKPDHAGQMVIE